MQCIDLLEWSKIFLFNAQVQQTYAMKYNIKSYEVFADVTIFRTGKTHWRHFF